MHILSGRANNYSLSDTFGSTIIPLGKRTTKYIRWIGPSLVAEKQKKPMRDWPCSKFLALHCINLYAVENPSSSPSQLCIHYLSASSLRDLLTQVIIVHIPRFGGSNVTCRNLRTLEPICLAGGQFVTGSRELSLKAKYHRTHSTMVLFDHVIQVLRGSHPHAATFRPLSVCPRPGAKRRTRPE